MSVGKIDAGIFIRAGNKFQVEAVAHVFITGREKICAVLFNVAQIGKPRRRNLRCHLKVDNIILAYVERHQKFFHFVKVVDAIGIAANQPNEVLISTHIFIDERERDHGDFFIGKLKSFVATVHKNCG